MTELIVSNPRKKRRKMSAKQRKYFGKRKRSGTRTRTRTIVKRIYRRSSAPRATRRRRSGGGGFRLRGGGLMGAATFVGVHGAAAAAGVIATPMILDRIPWVKDQQGNMRIGAMLGLAVVVAAFGPKFLPNGFKQYAEPIATGIAASAATTFYTNWQASRGMGPPLPAAPALSGGIGQPGGVGYYGVHTRRRFIPQRTA